jgi:antitoxin CptB
MSELSRLRWRCRRGMRELDVVLVSYLDHQYATATPAHRAAFARLLECPDPDLLDYLTRRATPPDPDLNDVVDAVRAAFRPARG